MEVPFTAATETQLRQFAERDGRTAAQVVEEIVAAMLKRQTGFTISSAGRGRLIGHCLPERIERSLRT